MCEQMYNHEFTCQGPLLDSDREQFAEITAAFIGNTAEEPAYLDETTFREPGTPMPTEFNHLSVPNWPLRLEGFRANIDQDPFEDSYDLGELGGLTVGVGDNEQLFNAATVLHAIGRELDVDWQPSHERLG